MVKVRTKPRFCREGTREEGDAIDALLALGDNINTKIRDRNREFFYNFLPPLLLCVVVAPPQEQRRGGSYGRGEALH